MFLSHGLQCWRTSMTITTDILTNRMRTIYYTCDIWNFQICALMQLNIFVRYFFSFFSVPLFQSSFGLDFIDWSGGLVLATITCFTAQHNYRETERGKEENKKKRIQKSICATGPVKVAVKNNDNVDKRDISKSS